MSNHTRDLFGDVSTVDDGIRPELDFFETPAWMTRSLLAFCPTLVSGTRVLECCSGRDAIAEVLRREHGCQVFTNDVDPRHPAQTHHDATDPAYWRDVAPRVDWIVTNPPFNVAMDILTLAVLHAGVGVAMLLRKTFLEPTENRGPWLMANPPSRMVGEPRYGFRGKGSDSVSCDWMIWNGRFDVVAPAVYIDYLAETRRGQR